MKEFFFHDFGKAAFGTLDLVLEADAPGTAEVAVGECSRVGKVDRTPGGFRYIGVCQLPVAAGRKKYRLPLPPHPPRGGAAAASPLPDEEIAPFRYVEITGPCRVGQVRRNEIFPDGFHDDDARFVSSEEKLNRVWEFCKYSIKATAAFGLFIDGERERLPYEGDTCINQLGWFCCCPDPAIPRRTITHLLKNPTWPTEWRLLMPLIVRDYLLYSGDEKPLPGWLPALKESLLDDKTGEDLLLHTGNNRRGDNIDWPESERDGYELGKINLVPNCYRFGALEAMTELTGDPAFRRQAEALRDKIREMMMKEGRFVDSPGSTHTALHSLIFPLFFGVGTQKECSEIRNSGMRCSVYAAQFLLEAMFRHGMEKEAMELLCADSERSWLNMLAQGSTITMEAWNADIKPNQDWNHAWGAAPANIIPRFVGGIRPVSPGFRKFLVDPHPTGLEFFDLRHPIPGGKHIELEYSRGKIKLAVPEGTSGICGNREYPSGTHCITRTN